MTLHELIPLAIKVSIVAIVFALGLKTDAADLTFLFRRPSLLVRSLLSINLVMPLVAALIVRLFSLHPAVSVMIIALALAPLPPVLPGKNAKAGGDAAYTISLLVMAGLFAILSIPLSVEIIGRVLGLPLHIPPAVIVKIVAVTVVLPLAAGLIVARLLPRLADRVSDILSKVATGLLLLAAVAVFVGAWPEIVGQIGDGTLLALSIFVIAGLAIGHLLGGPDPDDRSVLALSTASRHPGIALALAQLTSPGTPAIMAVLLIYLIVNAVLGIPYIAWRKARGAVLPPP